MRITALVENTSPSRELRKAHGLSLYIETGRHRILFDVGPSGDALFANARALSVDLASVDVVVLSHGHADHGGALAAFLEGNHAARVYAQASAFEPHRAKLGVLRFDVGLESALAGDRRLIRVDGDHRIDEELLVIARVPEISPLPGGNASLLARREGAYVPDDFAHEQNLLIAQDGRNALVCGCAHRGIVNIVHAGLRHAPALDLVVGGFHLYNPVARRGEPPEVVARVAQSLLDLPARYMTCHCTGRAAFARLRERLGDRLAYLSTGMSVAV